ncbi:hypothetical protein [Actinomadura rupiterrae]|uniref:hypothetical protein n=1 Tax=Actinomadura rupiterrae TaxID=559627 RepID=UPI0020A3A432|nr:hypothetical protein [Actinomadura rupiterrae]MCP2343146.1 hypothetical protein [Actinomadura rupiterrae]
MDFLRNEIDRQLGPSVKCSCGRNAVHVAEDLLYLAEAGNGSPRVNAFEGHVFDGDVIYEVAVPVAKVCMAALTQELTIDSRVTFMLLLYTIVTADGQDLDIGIANRNIVEECLEVARRGVWLLYAEVLAGVTGSLAGHAFMIIQTLGDDPDRLRAVHRMAQPMLDWVPLLDENDM